MWIVSYLFQQLKKEIVRIADMTEWNGFQLLNGTAGDQVGPEPVFKISSSGEYISEINYSSVTKTVTEQVAHVGIALIVHGLAADHVNGSG